MDTSTAFMENSGGVMEASHKPDAALPRYMRPTRSTIARSGSETAERFVFHAGTHKREDRRAEKSARVVKTNSARAQSGGGLDVKEKTTTKTGVKVHTPAPRKVARTSRTTGSVDLESTGSFLDSVLVQIQRQGKLPGLEPNDLKSMRRKFNEMTKGPDREEFRSRRCPSGGSSEALLSNKHHHRLDELIAQCANLNCHEPCDEDKDSLEPEHPSSPVSSEASVTSMLRSKDLLSEEVFHREHRSRPAGSTGFGKACYRDSIGSANIVMS